MDGGIVPPSNDVVDQGVSTMRTVRAGRLSVRPARRWRSDKLFPLAHAERLAVDFPNATLQPISDASTYVMLDRPDELAKAITECVQSSPS
jgi:pimeloyl-ACP methyl ester carboxylesterase